MQLIMDITQILAGVATILGVPVALLVYYQSKKREQRDREYGTYNALDEKYMEWLKICFDNPDLDVLEWLPMKTKLPMTPERERREILMYAMLISIMERSFLMYRDQSTAVKKAQWSGWADDALDISRWPGFRRAWPIAGSQMDADFSEFMDHLIAVGAVNPESSESLQ